MERSAHRLSSGCQLHQARRIQPSEIEPYAIVPLSPKFIIGGGGRGAEGVCARNLKFRA